MEDFEITVASLPDRENIVAEIAYKGYQWVELSNECGKFIIQFYPHPNEDFWEFPIDEALNILQKAKEKYQTYF